MRYFRKSYSLVLAGLLLLVASACKKEAEPSPLGSLKLTITYPNNAYTTYYLYTELAWAGPRTASALRQDKLNGTSYNGKQQSVITLDNLNPGNYVFSLNTGQGQSVQVNANRESAYYINF